MQNNYAYKWEGINQKGMRKQGYIYAPSLKSAKNILIKRKIVLTKIRKDRITRVSKKNIIDFCRQLSLMINSKINLVTALDIMENSTNNTGMKILIINIKNDMNSGLALSQCLKKHEQYFDELFQNLIYIGEQTSTLNATLKYLTDYKERIFLLKQKIKKAMFYPVMVLLVSIIVSFILLLFVIPEFTHMFQGLQTPLPSYTKLIIELSKIVQKNFYIVLILFFITAISFRYLRRTSSEFTRFLDSYVLKIPIFGNILKKSIISKIMRTLSITFKAGLPMDKSLDIISKITGNSLYNEAILSIKESLINGKTMTFNMERKLFPNRVVQMIKVGENSGALASILEKISEYYEIELNHTIDNLSILIEPIIMIILGILVGGLVIGMYLPIFKLGNAI